MHQEAIRRDIAYHVKRITGEIIVDGDPVDDVLTKILTALKTADSCIGNLGEPPAIYVHPNFFSHIEATSLRVAAAPHVMANEATIIDRSQRQHTLSLNYAHPRAD